MGEGSEQVKYFSKLKEKFQIPMQPYNNPLCFQPKICPASLFRESVNLARTSEKGLTSLRAWAWLLAWAPDPKIHNTLASFAARYYNLEKKWNINVEHIILAFIELTIINELNNSFPTPL